MLEENNPGYICYDNDITCYQKKDNILLEKQTSDSYNALFISNASSVHFFDLSAIEKSNVEYLVIQNTSIKSLEILRRHREKMQGLWLYSNYKLTDYTTIKFTNLWILHIENTMNFTDTQLIPPTVSTLFLVNTGVSKIKLLSTERIETLHLERNNQLRDYYQINDMKNLRELSLTEWDSISLINFPKLRIIAFHNSNFKDLPYIPQKNLELIVINKCSNLKSIAKLKGIKIKKLWLFDDNVNRFFTDIETLELEELILGGPNINLNDLTLNRLRIKLKKLRINSIRLK